MLNNPVTNQVKLIKFSVFVYSPSPFQQKSHQKSDIGVSQTTAGLRESKRRTLRTSSLLVLSDVLCFRQVLLIQSLFFF